MPRTIWFLGAMLLLAACSSLPVQTALERVQVGMSKPEVLEVAGSPKRTYREHSQDHWIYVYFENDREIHRVVVFEAGKVAKVHRPRAKVSWDKEIEGLGSPRSDSGFKSIDGGGD